jgi:hypothetical protein
MKHLLRNGGYVTLKALDLEARALKPVVTGPSRDESRATAGGTPAPQEADDSLALICLEFG